jgi:hypothetical protein
LLVKKRNKAAKSKVIQASDRLTDYLNETLKLEELKSKPKQKAGLGLARKIRSNDEKKVRTLDYLFRSMADIIYFFEFVNENPELIDRFDDDILDMLGLREPEPHAKDQDALYPAFSRLIKAVICVFDSVKVYPEVMNGQDYGKPKLAYRYHLLGIMQHRITEKAMPVYSKPYLAAKAKAKKAYPTEYTNEEDRKAVYDKFFMSQQLVDKLDRFWVSSKLDNPSLFPKRSIIL